MIRVYLSLENMDERWIGKLEGEESGDRETQYFSVYPERVFRRGHLTEYIDIMIEQGRDKDVAVLTDSDLVFNEFRCALKEQKINPSDIEFIEAVYSGNGHDRLIHYNAGEDGDFEIFPNIMNTFESQMTRLLPSGW